MSDRGTEQTAAPRRRGRIWLVVAGAALLGVAIGWLLTRAPGPPDPPGDVTAEPFRCSGSCRRLDASITLRWSAPAGGSDPTGYRIERDGLAMSPENVATAGADATAFVDRDVTFGDAYEYRVVALSTVGSSAASAAVTVRLPRPPTTSAQLTGEYIVHLTVRDARALSSALGIDQPAPGDTDTDRWTFEPMCSPPMSACPVRWEGLDGHLVADGRSWSGTVTGPDARCGGGTNVAAPTRFDLMALRAGPDANAWVVRSFEGKVSISFHCPGFLISRGSVDVRGIRR